MSHSQDLLSLPAHCASPRGWRLPIPAPEAPRQAASRAVASADALGEARTTHAQCPHRQKAALQSTEEHPQAGGKVGGMRLFAEKPRTRFFPATRDDTKDQSP